MREGEHETAVEACAREELEPAGDRRQQRGLAAGGENGAGMLVEGERPRLPADLAGTSNGTLEDAAMSEVDAIEETGGEDQGAGYLTE
jgi:hypothetical protein